MCDLQHTGYFFISAVITFFSQLYLFSAPKETPVSLNRVPSHIIGGQVAKPGKWRWQAGLKRSEDKDIFSGGSLIAKQWILTASHCLYDMVKREGKPKIIAVLGEFNQKVKSSNERNLIVNQIILHEGYSHATLDYDVDTLHLESPVEYSDFIRPICLPRKDIDFIPGEYCFVTGFGLTEEDGEISAKLQEAQVPIVPAKDCQKAFPLRKLTPRMLCAGFAEGGIDACQGDSEGPLVCQMVGSWYQKGVVSWGWAVDRKESTVFTLMSRSFYHG